MKIKSTSVYPYRFFKSLSVVAIFTLITYVLGYLRDGIIASIYGVSTVTDAFIVGTLVTTIVYTIFVTGSLVPAFLPVLSSFFAKNDDHEVWYVTSSVFNIFIIILLLIVLIGEIWSVSIIRMIAPGFTVETTELASTILRITLPMVLIIAPASFAGAILNSQNRFVITSIGPVINNVVIVASALFFATRYGIISIAIGMVIGAILQTGLQISYAIKTGMRYHFVIDPKHKHVNKIFQIFIPLFVYFTLAQLVPVIEKSFASGFTGGLLTSMAFALKISLIPNLVVTTSLSIILFPVFSRSASDPDTNILRNNLSDGIEMSLFLIIPLLVWILVFRIPIIRMFFEHGQFTYNDSLTVSNLLVIYMIGIIPMTIQRIMINGFYAQQDTKTPLLVGFISTISYIALCGILRISLGVFGLALSFSIAQFISAILLPLIMKKRLGSINGRKISNSVIKYFSASIIMGLSLKVFYFFTEILLSKNVTFQLALLSLSFVLGIFIYLITCKFMNVKQIQLILNRVK